jgi:hypothetical protein
MTDDEAIDVVTEAALEWAGEYGWSLQEDALKVLRAILQLRPALIPDQNEVAAIMQKGQCP